jgi:tRNA 2-thiouridine synthesizing protein A
MADRYLDCRKLQCPSPIVRISKTIEQMAPGQTLLVEAEDPAFELDVQAWSEMTGHELVEWSASPVQQAVIRKK